MNLTQLSNKTASIAKRLEIFESKIGLYALSFCAFLFLVGGLLVINNISLPKQNYLFFLAIVAILVITHLFMCDKISVGRTRDFLIATCMLILLLNVLWILAVPTVPYSDFDWFDSIAKSAAHSHNLASAFSGKSPLYTLLLSSVYILFGDNLLAAKMLNVVLHIITALVLFLFTKEIFDERIARITSLIFALSPSQTVLSSVLASEHLYGAFLIGGLLYAAKGLRPTHNNYINILKAGIVLGISNYVRPISSAVLAALALFYIAVSPKNKLYGILIIFIFLLISHIIPWHYDINSQLSTNLVFGTNYTSGGGWNEYESGGDFKNAVHIAYNRISSDPKGFFILFFEKFETMWASNYGFWAFDMGPDKTWFPNHEYPIRYIIAWWDFYYAWVLILCAFGCYVFRNNGNPGVYMILSIFLAFLIVHTFMEVQGRYRYPFEISIFYPLAGYGISAMILQRSKHNKVIKGHS